MKLSRQRIFTLRSLLALSLMLWSAGTGCMMVSYARAAANEATGEPDLFISAMGSMSMAAHACCKAKSRSARTHHDRLVSRPSPESVELNLLIIPATPGQSGVMNCCPLTSGSIVVDSRSQSNERSTVLQPSDSSALLLVTSDSLPLKVSLRLPNRAHSYLLDCAFLI